MTKPTAPDPDSDSIENVHEVQSHRVATRPSSGTSGAIQFSSLQRNSPTATTQPEMNVVLPPNTEILERADRNDPNHRSAMPSLRASWSEAPVSDPITEPAGRATELSLIPTTMQKRDRLLLLRMDGVHAGQVIPLNEPNITIGRHPDNAVVIDDTGVSRFHADLTTQGGQAYLIDRGARNGTLVQGTKVTGTVALQDGDFIQLGPRVGFRFSVTDAKQERLLQRLYESSNRDSLTGAYNRKHFDERLAAELAFAARNKSSTALVIFDIDHFKKVNDTYGHAAGDAVLRNVAGITMTRLRAEDVFARIGGEEFVVLLRGVTIQGAARLAERLRTSISARPTMFEGRSIPVTISLGCAALLASGEANEATEFIREADSRLYQAKNGGRNRTVAE